MTRVERGGLAGGGDSSGARSALGDAEGVALAAAPRGSTSAYIRIAVLLALLILAVYTGFAIVKLEHTARQAPDIGDPAAAAAESLAGHAEGEIARLQAALTAAGAVAQRLPAQPMDAAEAAFKGELTQMNPDLDPVGWAVAQTNLARIYESRAEITGHDNGGRAKAAMALDAALDVFAEHGLRSLSDLALQGLVRLREHHRPAPGHIV